MEVWEMCGEVGEKEVIRVGALITSFSPTSRP